MLHPPQSAGDGYEHADAWGASGGGYTHPDDSPMYRCEPWGPTMMPSGLQQYGVAPQPEMVARAEQLSTMAAPVPFADTPFPPVSMVSPPLPSGTRLSDMQAAFEHRFAKLERKLQREKQRREDAELRARMAAEAEERARAAEKQALMRMREPVDVVPLQQGQDPKEDQDPKMSPPRLPASRHRSKLPVAQQKHATVLSPTTVPPYNPSPPRGDPLTLKELAEAQTADDVLVRNRGASSDAFLHPSQDPERALGVQLSWRTDGTPPEVTHVELGGLADRGGIGAMCPCELVAVDGIPIVSPASLRDAVAAARMAGAGQCRLRVRRCRSLFHTPGAPPGGFY